MKKTIFSVFLILIVFFCNAQNYQTTPIKRANQRSCGTMEYMQQLISADPDLENRWRKLDMEIDKWVSKNPDSESKSIINIPVVVHIVYNVNHPEENIPDSVVQQQIDILNRDYAGLNPHSMGAFDDSLKANTMIQFCLARRDPDKNPTTGIERRATTHDRFMMYNYVNNDAKHYSDGGLDQWDPNRYMNIWVCNLDSNWIGYAEFPTEPLSNTYGVIIHYGGFGLTNTYPPYNFGATTTHEIGHCFSLRHIWGDDQGNAGADTCASGSCCNGSDYCSDTPVQSVATNGHHVGLLTDTCSSTQPGIMYMNFMDYSADEDKANFTPKQKTRMQAVLSIPGRFVYSLAHSCSCLEPTAGIAPTAFFYASPTSVYVGDVVPLVDLSSNCPDSWRWQITPNIGFNYVLGTDSSTRFPKVQFTVPGLYNVQLIVENSHGIDTLTVNNYINVAFSLPCDTIKPAVFTLNSCADSLVFYKDASAGFITGNNNIGTLEVAQRFDASGMLTAVVVDGFKASGVSDTTYAKIYDVNPVTKAPQNLLGVSNPLNLAYVCFVPHKFTYVFSNPVQVSGPFYASVVLPVGAADTLIVLSTQQNCYSNDSLSWELRSPMGAGNWHSIEHSWQVGGQALRTDLAIFPYICSTSTTNVSDISSLTDDVKVFPNPSNGSFTIDLSQASDAKEIRLIDMLGNILLRQQTNNQAAIELSHLQDGIYILSVIYNDNSVRNKKIISCRQ